MYTLFKQVIIITFIIIIIIIIINVNVIIIIINNNNNNTDIIINNNIIIGCRKGSTHAVVLSQPLGDVVGTPPHPARMTSVFEQEMVFQGSNLKPQQGMVSDCVCMIGQCKYLGYKSVSLCVFRSN